MKSLIFALLLMFSSLAFGGEFITEIGGGWVEPYKSSYLVTQSCKKTIVIEPLWPSNPRGLKDSYSCGGDMPIFIGWLVAYEFNNGNTRVGLWHKSNWFDNQGELQFNCVCATHTIRWKNRFKRFKK